MYGWMDVCNYGCIDKVNGYHFMNEKVYYICCLSDSLLTYNKAINPSIVSVSGYLLLI